MKMSVIAVVFLFLTVAASGAQRNALPLVEDGQSRAVIVVQDDASPGILETAQDLSEIIPIAGEGDSVSESLLGDATLELFKIGRLLGVSATDDERVLSYTV